MTKSRNRLNSLLGHLSIMVSKPQTVFFGPYEVTDQVFYHSTFCYGLTNIKPVLPGHVLVVPFRPALRLTDLTVAEVTDFFTTVQKVQKMLASHYFKKDGLLGKPEDGSFNIAIQDGKEAGQTVPHLHCHIIPRTRNDQIGDEVYHKLESEEGNIGGGFYDLKRPAQYGKFPQIEGSIKEPRSQDEMKKEAVIFREMMNLLENK
ncbi:Bis(5'-adenosyl)-triphosphatase [Erysiphe necator]|uniref:Bis(5'-adenosyl)-triphosphatase n=1 Tax=Uncinula necator TaxID=52586 RepID=A0A0B1PHF1_UNCNE|nr:Bis(5'-adenosyl)-triphosphatase [Erysiphe necator]KHJ35974.1 putative bis(5 -adenosyl)-triphosphatase [Erysiphe necator]